MTKFEELLQQYVNKDYNELLSIGRSTINILLPECNKYYNNQNTSMIMILFIVLAAIGADGVLTTTERRFICDLLNIPDDQVDGYIKKYDASVIETVDKFADNTSKETKSAILTLVLAICSCDEKINRQETAFIRKILI